VYVNYGVPEDYEELERGGVSVKGAIVIARYGHAWRGIKPLVAGEHGAVGCIIIPIRGTTDIQAGRRSEGRVAAEGWSAAGERTG